MKDFIDNYLRHLAVRGFAQRSIETYGECLYGFLYYLNGIGVSLLDVNRSVARDYTVSLVDRKLHPITINHRVVIIRVFYNWLIGETDQVKSNAFSKITKQPSEELLPVFFLEHEMKRLYRLIEDDNSIKVQHLTMFDVFFSTGIRTSELCNLKTTDITHDLGHTFLRVRGGKGNKDREVIMQKWGWESLEKHLIGLKLRGFKNDYVFPNKFGRRMLRQTVYGHISKIIGKVKDRRLGAHTLRHTYATYLMNHGTPIKGVQMQLGHESAATTQRYTHLDINRLIEVHNQAMGKVKGDGFI